MSSISAFELGVQGGQWLGGAHHWLRHAQLLGQGLSTKELAAIFAVEKVSHKGTHGARVRGRAEGEEEEWEIESCRVPLACRCGTGRGARSRLMWWAGAAAAATTAAGPIFDVIPRALSSWVQMRINCWTSSGSMVLRVQASSHRGFWGCWLASWSRAPFLDLSLPSLPLRREKRPGMMVSGRRSPVACLANRRWMCATRENVVETAREKGVRVVVVQSAETGRIRAAAMQWFEEGEEKEIFLLGGASELGLDWTGRELKFRSRRSSQVRC